MRAARVGRPSICRKWVRTAILPLLMTVCGLLAGLWWALGRPDPAPIGVVIITLDTTRADRLSPYGFMNISTPYLDRLAREGVLFDQASSVAPLTLPAHCSLFTGLLPPAHGVRDNGDRALAATHTTLAEILRAQGFRTAAFVGSVVLDADRGLAQGFEHYSGVGSGEARTSRAPQRRADEVITDATRWLETVVGSQFFLWIHLYDPHRPYDPPEPYRSIYADPYVGEIAFADSQIGRLLDDLDRRHLLDRTIVIVAGDHGESLGEHGERDHGIFVYESVLRVPLIIRTRQIAPRRIGEIVRLTDIMPTVLDLLALPVPSGDGVSLVDLMNGKRRHLDLEAYSESMYPQRYGWSPLRALHDGRFKVIDAPRPELYDLETDPFEERNLYDERRALAQALTRRVRTVSSAGGASAPVTAFESAVMPDGLRDRLAALGYVGSGTTSVSPGEHLPDPKDCIGLQKAVGGRSATTTIAAASGRSASGPDDLVAPAHESERAVSVRGLRASCAGR